MKERARKVKGPVLCHCPLFIWLAFRTYLNRVGQAGKPSACPRPSFALPLPGPANPCSFSKPQFPWFLLPSPRVGAGYVSSVHIQQYSATHHTLHDNYMCGCLPNQTGGCFEAGAMTYFTVVPSAPRLTRSRSLLNLCDE